MVKILGRKWGLWKGLQGLAIAGLLLLSQSVQAQVKVSPLVISTQTQQGQASGVITLTNQGSEPVRLRLRSQPFTYTKDGFSSEANDPNDLSPYLMFSPGELVIEPGQRRRVRLIARLLPSMASGEYRSVIFVEPLREQTPTSGMVVNSRIGVTVYVRHGQVSFQLQPQTATYNATKKEIDLFVHNAGNATARPGVSWQLMQNGQPLTTGRVTEITVISGGDRRIPLRLPENMAPLKSGSYNLQGNLLWGDAEKPEKLPFSFQILVP